jgi:hypothetical protein
MVSARQIVDHLLSLALYTVRVMQKENVIGEQAMTKSLPSLIVTLFSLVALHHV